mgnify:CR=1 FL=1
MKVDRRTLLAGLGVSLLAREQPSASQAAVPVDLDAMSIPGLQIGDHFTIEGYHAIDPVTHQLLPTLQTFVVRGIAPPL